MNCPFQLERRTKATYQVWLQCTFRYFFATENDVDFAEIKKQILTRENGQVKTFDYLT